MKLYCTGYKEVYLNSREVGQWEAGRFVLLCSGSPATSLSSAIRQMFSSNASSSSEDGETPRTPFNAISAAAAAQRQRLSRQGRISRARAAPEDEEAFAYDEALEYVERSRRAAPRPERKSRYIGKLVKQVEERKDEMQQVQERRLVKEREQEDHLYKDKERFVTQAYKRQLAERAEKDEKDKEEEERLRTQRATVSGFVRGLPGIGGMERAKTGGEGGEDSKDAVEEGERDSRAPNNASGASRKATVGALETGQQLQAGEENTATSGELGKKRRRSRFADMTTEAHNVPQGDANGKKTVKLKPRRGLRRNDEVAIEAYRQRYFQRRAKRLAERAKSSTGGAG